MTNALAVYGQFDQLQKAAMALYKSGYFTDSKNEAQAVVKVMAGAELGLPPFTSMTGIHIIQGKPALGSNLLATLIKNHPHYNYRVLELNDKVCKIQFFENGEACGVSEFTIEEARRAGTKNLDKFPKNMLFARAISNGARWFAPGVFGGAPVYTPEELGADVDEDGYIVEGEIEHPEPKQQVSYEATPLPVASPERLRALHAAGSSFYGKDWDNKRPALVSWASGKRTNRSKELTPEEVEKLIAGINKKADTEKQPSVNPEPSNGLLFEEHFGNGQTAGAYQD